MSLLALVQGCSGPQPDEDPPPTTASQTPPTAGAPSSIDLNAGFLTRRDPTDPAADPETSDKNPETLDASPPPEPPAPYVPRYHPFLASEDATGSASIGTTSDGYLVGGIPLPQHPHLQVLPTQAARDLAYGSKHLIDSLVFAADAVAKKYPGTVTFLGNIGRRSGGDIPYSVSHNTGRDVDIAFVATNPFGWQTRPQTLLHFNADLQSVEHFGFYRFDVARNAALTVALFSSPHTQVQHLFMADPLKRHLMAYWKKTKLNPTLLANLDEAISQPSDSAAHDDHLHLRVACSAEDLCHGCVHTGRARPWMPDDAATVSACTAKLNKTALRDKDPEQRARALERLVLLNAQAHHDTAAAALQKDKSDRVRASAAFALAHLAPPKTSSQILAKYLPKEPSERVRCAMPALLSTIGNESAAQTLSTLLADETLCPAPPPPYPPAILIAPPAPEAVASIPLAELAALASAEIEHKAPVPALIARLSDPRPSVRAASAAALERLTNRPDPTDWLTSPPEVLAESVAAWETWYKGAAKQTRDQWLVAGFQTYGYAVKELKPKTIPGLVEAILGPAPHSYNAQRVLMRLTDHAPRSLDWPATDAHAYWLRYAQKNQKRLKIKF